MKLKYIIEVTEKVGTPPTYMPFVLKLHESNGFFTEEKRLIYFGGDEAPLNELCENLMMSEPDARMAIANHKERLQRELEAKEKYPNNRTYIIEID